MLLRQSELHLGNAYEGTKQIPTASVDLIPTDSPYNLSPYSTDNAEFAWRKDLNNNLAEWEKVKFKPIEWTKEFKRILKSKGNIAFCGSSLVEKWYKAFDFEIDAKYFRSSEKRLNERPVRVDFSRQKQGRMGIALFLKEVLR